MHYTKLYFTLLYYIRLYYIIFDHSILYYSIPYHIVLYYGSPKAAACTKKTKSERASVWKAVFARVAFSLVLESGHLFVCLLVCLFACLLPCMFVCLFVCLFVCVFVLFVLCLFVCLFVCAVIDKYRHCIRTCIGTGAFFVSLFVFGTCLNHVWGMFGACLEHVWEFTYEVLSTTVSWKHKTTPVRSFSFACSKNAPCSNTFPRPRSCCMIAISVCVASSPVL